MNVYDFDNTVYAGESIVDFYIFLLKKNPRLLLLLPKILTMLVRYKMCRISSEELIETAQKYAAQLIDYARDKALVSEFWNKNRHKIKNFYLENKKPDDVILSANYDFLIEELCRSLGVRHVIASKADLNAGKIEKLCFGEMKPKMFRECFPDGKIDCFYTDSMNDRPMFELADKVYIVKGNKIKELMK